MIGLTEIQSIPVKYLLVIMLTITKLLVPSTAKIRVEPKKRPDDGTDTVKITKLLSNQ